MWNKPYLSHFLREVCSGCGCLDRDYKVLELFDDGIIDKLYCFNCKTEHDATSIEEFNRIKEGK